VLEQIPNEHERVVGGPWAMTECVTLHVSSARARQNSPTIGDAKWRLLLAALSH
jgi:hypothetical protein